MTRRRQRHAPGEDHEEGNSERWLLTYSDMITLLLALFIVLFAVSTINQKKFLALALGLKQSFNPNPGVLTSSNGMLDQPSVIPTAGSVQSLARPSLSLRSLGSSPKPTPQPSHTATTATTKALQQVEAEINAALAAKGLQSTVTMTMQTRGLVVQVLADKVFFATDSAQLGPVGNEVVDTIASVLRTDTYSVEVEGYTDNQPITGGKYTSNEELSAVRAVNVVLRLSNIDGLDPSRLAATGFGDTHPLVPNTSPANMARNRRIDVVVLAPQGVQP